MKFFTSNRSRRWLSAVLSVGLLGAGVMFLFWEDLRPHDAPSAADPPPGRRLVGEGKRVSQHEDAVAVTGDVGGEQNREAINNAEQIANEHRELPDAARGDLLAFISAGKPKALLDSEWQERVNVILNSLRDQQTGAASSHQGLTRLLVEMAAADADPILRMYAMQHLGLWYPRIADAADRAEVLELLTQILRMRGERSRGSALQALSDIARNGASEEVKQALAGSNLMEQAEGILSDRSETADVRICALQACVAHAHKDVLNPLREIATNAGEKTVLRKAAIHGIGELGNLADLELLELVRSEEVRCSVASEAAIKHLRDRHPATRLPGAAGTGNSF